MKFKNTIVGFTIIVTGIGIFLGISYGVGRLYYFYFEPLSLPGPVDIIARGGVILFWLVPLSIILIITMPYLVCLILDMPDTIRETLRFISRIGEIFLDFLEERKGEKRKKGYKS